ncbi:MAG: SpoIID/LytB domain-containing protein [Nitrospirae bacterium]|nr:SpoIID/LytB domain-containing protein [Candidatus Troglogloeales bacterium]
MAKQIVFLLLFLSLLFPERAMAETLRVILMEEHGIVRLTSTKPFTVHTGSSRVSVESAYQVAEISLRKGVTTPAGIAVNGINSLQKMLTFVPQRGGKLFVNGLPYLGSILIKARNGALSVVNEVDLEEYLQGVVPAEMPSDWPMDALKTQAVISRTYALYQKRNNTNKEYDLPASVLGQVYKGESVTHPRAVEAIEKTEGIIATYKGDAALTYFHSTSAGPTEDADERWGIDFPYLKGVSCPLDFASPYFTWQKEIPLSTLENSLDKVGVGAIATLTPLSYSKAGRILMVRILHARGETFLKAEELRRLLGYQTLPSTHFKIDSFGKILKISGMGWGHGVGLCQWGAKVMAERGLEYDEIVQYYYPGVKLQHY